MKTIPRRNYDLQQALGQYRIYRFALARLEPEKASPINGSRPVSDETEIVLAFHHPDTRNYNDFAVA